MASDKKDQIQPKHPKPDDKLELSDEQLNQVTGGTGEKPAFEIKDFSFGVENPTTIGSATGGAGAGKIKFNEFEIKKS